MVEGISFNKKEEYPIYAADIKNQNADYDYDESIFNSVNEQENSVSESDIELLNEQLDSVQENQGIFSKAWNGFKNATNLGVSSEDCEEAIEKYKNGEISYEEASQKIEEFKTKQDGSLNLFSNIATSFAAIAAATAAGAAIIATGGAATLPVLALVGAGTGAVTKAGFKMTDRATNEVEGDALDGKQLLKDGISGAVTGSVAAATMGTGSASSTLASSAAKSGLRSAKTGAITGAISGSANYTIDCAFDDNMDFNAGDMIKSAAQNAACTAVVGGVIGSANGMLRYTGKLNSGGMVKNTSGIVENATKKDIVANSACSGAYKIGNDRIHSFAS